MRIFSSRPWRLLAAAAVAALLLRGPAGCREGVEPGFSVSVVESVPAETGLGSDSLAKTPDVWKEMFSSARRNIRLGMFYLISEEGSRLEEIVQIIERRAAAGVRVRILTERAFYRNYPELADRFAEQRNIRVRVVDFGDYIGGIMHAKYFVVDDEHFYVGSTNFDWKSLEHIREIGLAGSSPEIARGLIEIFETDFRIAVGRPPRTRFHRPFRPDPAAEIDLDQITLRLVATPPRITPADIPLTEETLLGMINSAREEIRIDVFQYGLTAGDSSVYYDRVDRALRRAAARGVRVKLMVSDWSLTETQQVDLKSLQVIPEIRVRYLEIPEAAAGFIPFARVSHPKLLIVDRKAAWVGSSNWQPGYFDRSRNVGLVTGVEENLADLLRFFDTAWASPYARDLELDKVYSPPTYN